MEVHAGKILVPFKAYFLAYFQHASSLSLVISSFLFKVSDMWLFLSLEQLLRGHYRIINWPNLNIVVSQEMGRSEDRERDRGMASSWSGQNTKLLICCLTGAWFVVLQNNYNSNIKDHWSQITIKIFWSIARITKMWQRDMKWAKELL